MVKIVHHDWRSIEGALEAVIITDIRQSECFSVGFQFHVQLLPIVPLALHIDFLIQRNEFRLLLPDIPHDQRLEGSTQVQVLQPNEITLVLGTFDDGLHVCNAGKDGRYETGGSDAGIMEGFHGRKPSLDAHGFVHVILEGFVQRVNRPAYASTRECLDEIQVAEHQVALRGYRELDAAALKLFQQSPGTAILLLFWQIRVGNRAKEKLLAAQFFGVLNLRPLLDVEKFAPWLSVARKTFHE